MRRFLLIFVLSLLPLLTIANQCPSRGFRQLFIVRRGGYWGNTKKHGFYRVLVYRLGWEKTNDEIQLQRMMFNNQKKTIEVLNCSVIPKSASWSTFVKDVRFSLFRNNRSLLSIITYIPWIPGLTLRSVYIITKKGTAVNIMKTQFDQSALDSVYDREDL